MEHTVTPAPAKALRWGYLPRLAALAFWAALLIGYYWYAGANQLSPLEVVQRLLVFMQAGLWGPLVYVGLYTLRPLILFPSTLLTLAGGFVFGPVPGVLYTILASNLSSAVAYLVGRYFGQGLFKEDGSNSLIQRYAARLRANSFETVLIMRFIFLPYDLVTYVAGFLRIRFLPFLLATALGSIPGTIAFVGFGAAVERFDGTTPTLNPVTLGVAAVVFILSLALARLFKKREGIAP